MRFIWLIGLEFEYTLILKYNCFYGRYLYLSKFSCTNSKLVKWALKDITLLFPQLWVYFLSKKKIQFLFTSKTLPFLPLRGKLAGLYPEPLSEVNTAKRDFFCYISDTFQEQEKWMFREWEKEKWWFSIGLLRSLSQCPKVYIIKKVLYTRYKKYLTY